MALIDHIYEAVADDDAFHALAAAIADDVDARSCIMFGFDGLLRLTAAEVSYFSPEMIEFQRTNEVRAWDVWTAHSLSPARFGKIGNGDEIWDREAFKQTPFYNECVRRFGDDTISVVGGVVKTGDGYLSLAVHRGVGAPLFEQAQVDRLQELAPHLFRMLDLRARLESSRTQQDFLQSALNQIGFAVLVVDVGLRVGVTNKRAETLLAAGDVLRLQQGRLTTAEHRLQDRFSQAVQSAATQTGARGDALLVNRAAELPRCRVMVSPLARHAGQALVLVEDPGDRDASLAETLAKLYGLTTSVAALAALLAEGLGPEEAAVARNVKLTTVRTQIQKLLAKTDAQRLTELVRLLARVPRAE
jgi:DNA-binding CsgD family transcriptional regulator